jgi:hypothetical protein
MKKPKKDIHQEEPAATTDGVHRTRFSNKFNRDERGICCRACGCRHFKVSGTKPVVGKIRRLRVCRNPNCGHTTVTFEVPQSEM